MIVDLRAKAKQRKIAEARTREAAVKNAQGIRPEQQYVTVDAPPSKSGAEVAVEAGKGILSVILSIVIYALAFIGVIAVLIAIFYPIGWEDFMAIWGATFSHMIGG